MPAQLSGILLVAVFGLTALAGSFLAWRLVALSTPSGRRRQDRPPPRPPAPAVPAQAVPAQPAPAQPVPAPAEPDGTP